ncbi:hypothetical protein, partial [Miniimonas arenae]|uniref:hypothetical protein n=1 Tax=Miniimonas arenae TaxID=676201 RepID=UPI001C5831EC
MSTTPPDRTVAGLTTRRKAGASHLVRKNRPEPMPASPEQTEGLTATPTIDSPPPLPQASRVTADRSGKRADAGRAQISFAVSTELRDRA